MCPAYASIGRLSSPATGSKMLIAIYYVSILDGSMNVSESSHQMSQAYWTNRLFSLFSLLSDVQDETNSTLTAAATERANER